MLFVRLMVVVALLSDLAVLGDAVRACFATQIAVLVLLRLTVTFPFSFSAVLAIRVIAFRSGRTDFFDIALPQGSNAGSTFCFAHLVVTHLFGYFDRLLRKMPGLTRPYQSVTVLDGWYLAKNRNLIRRVQQWTFQVSH